MGAGDPDQPEQQEQPEQELQEQKEKPSNGKWVVYKDIDMCGQGDIEIIDDWRSHTTISEMREMVEERGYSAISVGNFDHAALKKFDYQLTKSHCEPSPGYTNEIHVYYPEGNAPNNGTTSDEMKRDVRRMAKREFSKANDSPADWQAWIIYIIPSLYLVLLAVWLLCVYDENIKELQKGTGPLGHCLKGEWGTIDRFVLGSGSSILVTVLCFWMIFFFVSMQCPNKKDCWALVAIIFGSVFGTFHFAFFLYGNVIAFSKRRDECGDILYQARFFIVLVYMWMAFAGLFYGMVYGCKYIRKEGEEDRCAPALGDCRPRRCMALYGPYYIFAYCMIVFVAHWFAVFFDANYSETQQMRNWKQGSCVVQNIVGSATLPPSPAQFEAAKFSCCSDLCSSCDSCPQNPHCDNFKAVVTKTPGVYPDGEDCQRGYHCCNRCGEHGQHCCRSTQARCCNFQCQWCLHPKYTIAVQALPGQQVVSYVTKDKQIKNCEKHGCYNENLVGMANFLTINDVKLYVGYRAECWYNPGNAQEVEWEIGYTWSRWFHLAIPSFMIVLSATAMLVGLCIGKPCQAEPRQDDWSDSEDNENEPYGDGEIIAEAGDGRGLVQIRISHAVTWEEAREQAEREAGGLPTRDDLREAYVRAGHGVDMWMPVQREDGQQGDYCQIGNHPHHRYISHIDAFGMPDWYTNTDEAGWRPGPESTSCKGFFYARAERKETTDDAAAELRGLKSEVEQLRDMLQGAPTAVAVAGEPVGMTHTMDTQTSGITTGGTQHPQNPYAQ